MKTDCPFLEPLRRAQGGSTYGCGAGVNFCGVGRDRERCRGCAVAMLGRLPDCGYLDAYTFLEGYPGGAPFVRSELFCGLTGDPLPNLLHCAGCPERQPCAAGLTRPEMAPALALALAG